MNQIAECVLSNREIIGPIYTVPFDEDTLLHFIYQSEVMTYDEAFEWSRCEWFLRSILFDFVLVFYSIGFLPVFYWFGFLLYWLSIVLVSTVLVFFCIGYIFLSGYMCAFFLSFAKSGEMKARNELGIHIQIKINFRRVEPKNSELVIGGLIAIEQKLKKVCLDC